MSAVWTYAANSLAWSGLGLLVGAALGQLGRELRTLVRHSGRQKRDDT